MGKQSGPVQEISPQKRTVFSRLLLAPATQASPPDPAIGAAGNRLIGPWHRLERGDGSDVVNWTMYLFVTAVRIPGRLDDMCSQTGGSSELSYAGLPRDY